jgi:hypothetical protein
LNANLAHAHYNLGMALQRLKDSDGAKQEFQEAKRLDPSLNPPN